VKSSKNACAGRHSGAVKEKQWKLRRRMCGKRDNPR